MSSEDFAFFVRLRGKDEVRVAVRRRAVALSSPVKGFLYAGVWDDGGYVRYQYTRQVPVHPAILDEIDAELRVRLPGATERKARRPEPTEKRGGHRRPRGAILELPPENLRTKQRAQ